jgi:RNA polymerase sigma factor (sigma-70 family)
VTRSDALDASRDAESQISALAARYRAGDSSALEPLYQRLTPAIAAVLARYRSPTLSTALTARDLEQQSWVILAEIARRWRPGGSFLAYFLRSFPREMRRYVQRASSSRRTRSVELRTIPHDDVILALDRTAARDPEPEDSLWCQETLGPLPPEERMAVALRVLGGWDFAAIGEALQVSRASAHRLVQRALAALPEAIAAPRPSSPGATASSSRRAERAGGGDAAADLVRLVELLHTLAAPDGTLPGRRRIGLVGGFPRGLLARHLQALEAVGAIVDRGGRRAGRLADATPAATLARLHIQD